jgi:hypothetical protein
VNAFEAFQGGMMAIIGLNFGSRLIPSLLIVSALLFFGPLSAKAAPAAQSRTTPSPQSAISPGTILPVILRSTISPERASQGQIVRGEIAQDVTLPDGTRVRKGSKIQGQIVDVSSAGAGNGAKISIRFDKVYANGRVIPMKTDLRALAGFMEVIEAEVPTMGIGEGDVYNWATTTQIGGDSVFGVGGTVASAHNTSETVGKSLMSGGVLDLLNPNEPGKCRGAIDGNNSPQALWVFSSDACGTYGLSKVTITDHGRTDPIGTFTLDLQTRKTKLQSGDAMLLRVIG